MSGLFAKAAITKTPAPQRLWGLGNICSWHYSWNLYCNILELWQRKWKKMQLREYSLTVFLKWVCILAKSRVNCQRGESEQMENWCFVYWQNSKKKNTANMTKATCKQILLKLNKINKNCVHVSTVFKNIFIPMKDNMGVNNLSPVFLFTDGQSV